MFKSNKGFTLVELIVVIAILAILAGVAVPAYTGYIKRANQSADDSQIAVMNQAIEATCALNGVQVSDVTVTLSGNEVLTVVITSGSTDITASYTTFYAGNTITLKYYTSLKAENGVVSGVAP